MSACHLFLRQRTTLHTPQLFQAALQDSNRRGAGMMGTSQRRMRRNHGITLIELMAALFVFVVAGSGIVGAFLSSNNLSEYSTESMLAVQDLKDLMERIHATPFSNLTTQFPAGVVDGGGGANNYAGILGGYTLDQEQITVTYPNGQPTGRLVMVATVSWRSHGRAVSTSLSTVRTGG